MEKVARRAEVETALVRAGGKVNMSALGRELGVSRWTIRRDVEVVKGRWRALAGYHGVEVLAERAASASALAAIAEEALGQYTRLAGEPGQHGAAIGYLRTAMQALGQRATLMGLPKRPPVRVF